MLAKQNKTKNGKMLQSKKSGFGMIEDKHHSTSRFVHATLRVYSTNFDRSACVTKEKVFNNQKFFPARAWQIRRTV